MNLNDFFFRKVINEQLAQDKDPLSRKYIRYHTGKKGKTAALNDKVKNAGVGDWKDQKLTRFSFFELQKNLDKAWDGRWFKRAYFKNGEALGSNQNDECKIDNISQSWAVISGVAKKEKQVMAMESVENYLVDHENMLIK